MNIGKMFDVAKTTVSVVLGAAFLGWCSTSTFTGISDAVKYRNEPVYLISRSLDPTFRTWGFIPDDVLCESPARCEPNGLPSLQYNVLLREHEVREWGLDPAQHRPFVENGQNLDW